MAFVGSDEKLNNAIALGLTDETDRPLVVDLDGTLVRSDLLVESFFAMMAQGPRHLLRLPGWLRSGKAVLKARIAEASTINYALLPFNEELLAHLREEKARGRRLFLASASDRRHVEAIAAHLGLFDGIFASDGATNLSGEAKALALCEAFDEGGFDYAGNAEIDLKVWARAHGAVIVDGASGLIGQLRRRGRPLLVIAPRRFAARDYLRQLRPHQWLKNLLVFLPVLTGHDFTGPALGKALLAFLAFSLCASGVYVVNDLLDLPADRDHARKRLRPLASGAVPILHTVAMAPLLLAAALIAAAPLGFPFLGILGGYFALTLAYSLALKRYMFIDVLTLGLLYTNRVVAGGAAAAIPVSPWLLGFSLFLFLSLAIVKRYTELQGRLLGGKGAPPGRGYVLEDLPVLAALGGGSGYCAVVVLALYINSPAVMAQYSRPDLLWGVCILLIYWISRILMLANRAQMHDDPVVFAVKDRLSLLIGACVLLVVLVAA